MPPTSDDSERRRERRRLALGRAYQGVFDAEFFVGLSIEELEELQADHAIMQQPNVRDGLQQLLLTRQSDRLSANIATLDSTLKEGAVAADRLNTRMVKLTTATVWLSVIMVGATLVQITQAASCGRTPPAPATSTTTVAPPTSTTSSSTSTTLTTTSTTSTSRPAQ